MGEIIPNLGLMSNPLNGMSVQMRVYTETKNIG